MTMDITKRAGLKKDTHIQLLGQSGFTLIEVMIAMVVLVIGVLGVLYMQLASVKGNTNSIGISRAVHEITAGIDTLQSYSFSDTQLSSGANKSVTDLFGTNLDAKKITDNISGTLTYDVTDLNAAQVKALFGYADTFFGASGKQITVKVTDTLSGTDKTVQLQFVKIDL